MTDFNRQLFLVSRVVSLGQLRLDKARKYGLKKKFRMKESTVRSS